MAILKHENDKMMLIYSTNTLRKSMNLGLLRRDTDMEVEFKQMLSLQEGEYFLTVAITNSYDSRDYDWQENLKSFQIKKTDPRWDGMVNLNGQIFIHK